jgi:hypothetical protein
MMLTRCYSTIATTQSVATFPCPLAKPYTVASATPLAGDIVSCFRLAILILAAAGLASPLLAQEPSDLKVQLRFATDSNRFQIGEVIPLEVAFSSATPNRYLEPCELFSDRNFGLPRCQFFSRWSFTITPDGGWVDLTKEFPTFGMSSGPSFDVPSSDLSSQPVTFSYVLTKQFRFDATGEYHVHLSIDVGLDDENTRRGPMDSTVKLNTGMDSTVKPHTVSVTREIVLQIVPARPEWQMQIIHDGYEAYSGPTPPPAEPPSLDLLQYEEATQALCNLGTPEAARVLAGLLARDHQEVQGCIDHTPSPAAAIEEMQRLLVDPDVAVNVSFFFSLAGLIDGTYYKTHAASTSYEPAAGRERDILLSVLPQKHGEAQVTSLLTALDFPRRGKGAPYGPGYDLPFEPSVITAVVANYDKFPVQSQQWLLSGEWARVRSPLMLPLVRRLAEAGNGPALLRWMELDPVAATDFAREEAVRPVPQFSSFYLRLPEDSLTAQGWALAANFVALTQEQDLMRSATLLHSYAYGDVLPMVLPFIDAKLSGWPCSVQIPVLAYLLKVSQADAAPRVERALREAKQFPCNSLFFTSVGFVEPSPVLERLALEQIEGAQPMARDAVDYLRLYGSAATKPFVWKEFVQWHQRYVASGAEKRVKDGIAAKITKDDQFQSALFFGLADAFIAARSWLLSQKDTDHLQALLGKEWVHDASCGFECGAPIGIGPSPATYYIDGLAYELWGPNPLEYLRPAERLRYIINQYHCADMQALKEKLLQFPAGSAFGFSNKFSPADQGEMTEISDFLWSHGYKVRNWQKWSFLRPDPAQSP